MSTTNAIERRDENQEVAQTANRHTFTPRCDIWETTDAVHLEAEMPGVDEKSVDVKLEDGVLSILGQVAAPEFEGYNRTYSEYEVGNFERSFRVSNDVDEAKIEANLKNGILSLTLPKREAAKPRRIQVKAA